MDALKLRYVASNTAVLAKLAEIHDNHRPDGNNKVDQVVVDAVHVACRTIADFIDTNYKDVIKDAM